MKFTRKEILKTIEKEPLKAGFFIYPDEAKALGEGAMSYEDIKLKQDKCPACVVGNLLRSKLGNKIEGMSYMDFREQCFTATKDEAHESANQIPALLADKNYLGAISSQFEFLAEQFKTMPPVRRHLAEWVKKNIPTEFTVKGI